MVIGAGGSQCLEERVRRSAGSVEPQLVVGGKTGAGAGSAAAQAAMIGVVETAARGLDVGLGPSRLRGVLMVRQRIEARQAGPRRKKHYQQEHGLELGQACPPVEAVTMHGPEYTHTRSGVVLRLTGPSAGSRNQKAAPFPNTESAPIVPPCISTNFLQRARPRPVPCARRLEELST